MSAQARPMTGPTAGLLALDLGLAAVLAVLWLAPGAPAQWRTWQAPQPQPPSLDDIDAAQLTPNPAAGAAYPGVLQKILTHPVEGLDNYKEMMRLLVEEKDALKVYVNVAEG